MRTPSLKLRSDKSAQRGSEVELKTDLDNPRVVRGSYPSKRTGVTVCADSVQRGVVEHVEELRAELSAEPFTYVGVLE